VTQKFTKQFFQGWYTFVSYTSSK